MKPGRLLLLAFALVACKSDGPVGPYRPVDEANRNPQLAQELTRQATEIAANDPGEAEKELRDALTADLFHGPAHNNLGILLLQRGLLYEAANEFEWARKLMPGNPEPRLNLGITLERAGHVEDALQSYRSAIEVQPGHLPSTEALACLLCRSGQTSDEVRDLVRTISLQGETEQWRSWARTRLLQLER